VSDTAINPRALWEDDKVVIQRLPFFPPKPEESHTRCGFDLLTVAKPRFTVRTQSNGGSSGVVVAMTPIATKSVDGGIGFQI